MSKANRVRDKQDFLNLFNSYQKMTFMRCPICRKSGISSLIWPRRMNENYAIWKCSRPGCVYPMFERHEKFKTHIVRVSTVDERWFQRPLPADIQMALNGNVSNNVPSVAEESGGERSPANSSSVLFVSEEQEDFPQFAAKSDKSVDHIVNNILEEDFIIDGDILKSGIVESKRNALCNNVGKGSDVQKTPSQVRAVDVVTRSHSNAKKHIGLSDGSKITKKQLPTRFEKTKKNPSPFLLRHILKNSLNGDDSVSLDDSGSVKDASATRTNLNNTLANTPKQRIKENPPPSLFSTPTNAAASSEYFPGFKAEPVVTSILPEGSPIVVGEDSSKTKSSFIGSMALRGLKEGDVPKKVAAKFFSPALKRTLKLNIIAATAATVAHDSMPAVKSSPNLQYRQQVRQDVFQQQPVNYSEQFASYELVGKQYTDEPFVPNRPAFYPESGDAFRAYPMDGNQEFSGGNREFGFAQSNPVMSNNLIEPTAIEDTFDFLPLFDGNYEAL